MDKSYIVWYVLGWKAKALCRWIKTVSLMSGSPKQQSTWWWKTDGQVFLWQPSWGNQRTDYMKDGQTMWRTDKPSPDIPLGITRGQTTWRMPHQPAIFHLISIYRYGWLARLYWAGLFPARFAWSAGEKWIYYSNSLSVYIMQKLSLH